jgi:mannose-6-phosphate isomerase
MYPILLTPIVKKMIWGQESWELSCRPKEMCIIENGTYAGTGFETFLHTDKEKTMGTGLAALPRFPLLIKIIDAREALSVQVHPDDTYAQAQQSADSGKSEMWYIIRPPHDGKLIIGLREGTTKDGLRQAYENGRVEDYLNYLHVKKGDIINIPAGLVHALTPGTIIAEVQQNSDTTYRLYDYNRTTPDGKPRELHIEHALAVTDFDNRIPREVTTTVYSTQFTVQQYSLGKPQQFQLNGESFKIIINVEGTLTISYNNGENSGEVTVGEHRTVFIPAAMGAFTVIPENKAKILYCSVPTS